MMSIPLTGTAGFFTRLGAIGAMLSDVRTFQNVTVVNDINAILAQFPAVADANLVSGLPAAQTSEQSSAGAIDTVLRTLAQQTLAQMVFNDNPQANRTNPVTQVKELLRQMNAASATVKRQGVTISAAIRSAVGGAVPVLSVLRGDGLPQELSVAETLTLIATSVATAGAEQWKLTAPGAQSNFFSPLWPAGSGAGITLTAVNGNKTSGGNLLANSGFATWTSGVPNKWVDVYSLKGAGFQQNGSAIQFNPGSFPALTQQFGSATLGTSNVLATETTYALNFFASFDRVPGAGIFAVELVNQNGDVVNDAQGVPQSQSFNLWTFTTATAAHSTVFRVPAALPATLKLQLRIVEPISPFSHLTVTQLGLAAMTEMYRGGPFIAVFSSAALATVLNDAWTVTVTNDRGGSSNLNSFQTLMSRLFPMAQNELLLPSSLTPTISDTLI